jgi:hypothetical protein
MERNCLVGLVSFESDPFHREGRFVPFALRVSYGAIILTNVEGFALTGINGRRPRHVAKDRLLTLGFDAKPAAGIFALPQRSGSE